MDKKWPASTEICFLRMLAGEMIAFPLGITTSSGFTSQDAFVFQLSGSRHFGEFLVEPPLQCTEEELVERALLYFEERLRKIRNGR